MAVLGVATALRGFEQRLRAVLFDLDGTLTTATFQPAEAKAALLRRLGELGVETREIKLEDTMANIVAQARSSAQKQRILAPDEFRERLDDFFDEFETAALSNVRLRDDARVVLDSLTNEGFKLGIVSNSGTKAVNAGLVTLGLPQYFRVVITRNGVRSLKPSGDGITRALRILRCGRERAAYIGDSWIDVRAARDAGVRAIALT